MDFLNYTLFAISGDRPVLLIDLLASVFGLTCVFLAGRNSKYNFWVGYVYTVLLFLMFWQKHLYSSMLLQPISLAINVFGHYRWTHPKTGEESVDDHSALKISRLSWKRRGFFIIGVLAFAALWGWALSLLGTKWFVGIFPAQVPYLDACVTMLILLAQYLSAQKKWDCWIVWLLVNITNIALYLSAGLTFMPVVSGLYLINGIWSLFTWYKLYNKEK